MRPNQAISPITALHPNHHSPIQMVFKIQSVIACLILTVGLGASNHCQTAAADDDQPTYENSAVPLFQKYCNSCHNADDMEGDLALDSPSGIAAGGGSGPALLPGDPKTSRMIRMITGQHDLKMPPDDADGPTQTEIEKLMAWIEGGAIVSNDISLAPKTLTVPEVNSKVVVNPITDVCWSPDGKLLAIARYQSIEVLSAVDKKNVVCVFRSSRQSEFDSVFTRLKLNTCCHGSDRSLRGGDPMGSCDPKKNKGVQGSS